MPTLGLIACSKSKGAHTALALLLYKGAMFEKSVRHARRTCDAYAILSAKYGLVMPLTSIAPYDQTLATMSAAARVTWATHVRAQLAEKFPGYDIVYYAGELYCKDLPPGRQPMKGMRMGERLQWLKKQVG